MKTNRLLLYTTDQRSCFDEDGNEIDCLNSGQDGAFGSLKPAALDRFKVIKNIVKDKWTGLVWRKNANLPDFPLTWKEAFEFVQEINQSQLSGRSDWRLPTRSELFSLISHQYINPSLPKNHPFKNIFHGYYWTSTECARFSNQAWYIHVGGARVYRGMKHGSYMVWPVAGIEPEKHSIDDRFVSNAWSFYDRHTQRTWLNSHELCNTPVTWQEALDKIKIFNKQKVTGYRDWRLPNIRELESLIEITKHSPALPPGCPIYRIHEGYWSGTTSLYEPSYAWVLYTRDGAIGVGFKPQADSFVLPVR